MADGSAVYIWLYANYWDWTFLRNAGFRHDLAHYSAVFFIGYLTLFCWSWTSGFMLGSAARASIPVNGLLFGFLLLFGGLLGAPPKYAGHALFFRARDFSGNAAVFELTFYRLMFPLIVQAALVLVPALWGMHQCPRVRRLGRLMRAILWAAAIATLAAIAIQNWGLVAIPYGEPGTWEGSPIRLLQLVVYWPLGYLLTSAIRRRWRFTIASIY